MKKSKMVLLSLGMALCVGGGIGAAVAVSRNQATNSGSGSFDSAINLYWGSKQTTATLNDLESLAANVPQYNYLTVSPEASKSVEGTVKVSFELSVATLNETTDTAVLKGLTVKVFETESLATNDTVASLISGKTAVVTLDKDHLTGVASFAVSKSTAAHEEHAYYAIQVVYDGSKLEAGEKLAGNLDITQSFEAAKGE